LNLKGTLAAVSNLLEVAHLDFKLRTSPEHTHADPTPLGACSSLRRGTLAGAVTSRLVPFQARSD
jgi:hypothetical protein